MLGPKFCKQNVTYSNVVVDTVTLLLSAPWLYRFFAKVLTVCRTRQDIARIPDQIPIGLKDEPETRRLLKLLISGYASVSDIAHFRGELVEYLVSRLAPFYIRRIVEVHPHAKFSLQGQGCTRKPCGNKRFDLVLESNSAVEAIECKVSLYYQLKTNRQEVLRKLSFIECVHNQLVKFSWTSFMLILSLDSTRLLQKSWQSLRRNYPNIRIAGFREVLVLGSGYKLTLRLPSP